MLIICPACSARYQLDGTKLPNTWRNMRCGRCGNRWQAAPIDTPADVLPTSVSEVGAHNPHLPGETVARTRAPHHARLATGDWEAAGAVSVGVIEAALPSVRAGIPTAHAADRRVSSSKSRQGQSFLLGIALALALAALYYRADVVSAVPASAGLYEMVGLPVNLRGLEFRDVDSERTYEDGLPVLVIEGRIANIRAEAVEVPSVQIAILGSRGEELYSWRVEPRRERLEAKEDMRIRTRLTAPPSGARDIRLQFVDRRPALASEVGR
jgi:predicted Zn finger-like uncharacterized protein